MQDRDCIFFHPSLMLRGCCRLAELPSDNSETIGPEFVAGSQRKGLYPATSRDAVFSDQRTPYGGSPEEHPEELAGRFPIEEEACPDCAPSPVRLCSSPRGIYSLRMGPTFAVLPWKEPSEWFRKPLEGFRQKVCIPNEEHSPANDVPRLKVYHPGISFVQPEAADPVHPSKPGDETPLIRKSPRQGP